MNQRKMMFAAVIGSVLLGLPALVGLASHFAVQVEDDDDDR
jgi:hypothetical protein